MNRFFHGGSVNRCWLVWICRLACAAGLCLFGGLGEPVHAAIIIQDDFSYADGLLAGNNGGTGFSEAWNASAEAGGSEFEIVSGQLTRSTSSGKAEANRDFRPGGGGFELARAGNEVWFRIDLTGLLADGTDGNAGLMLSAANYDNTQSLPTTTDVGLGFRFFGSSAEIGLVKYNSTGGANNSDQRLAYDAGNLFLIGQIQYNDGGSGDDIIRLWSVSSTGGVLRSGGQISHHTSVNNSAFDQLAIYDNQNKIGWDSITFGYVAEGETTQDVLNQLAGGDMQLDFLAIPEPATLSMLALGWVLFVLRKRTRPAGR